MLDCFWNQTESHDHDPTLDTLVRTDYRDMSRDLSNNSNRMNHPIKIVILAMCIFVISGGPRANANPDVWVKAGIAYRVEDNNVIGLSFTWQFDEYFSSRAIRSFDSDRSGVLEPKEIKRLRVAAFDPLARFDYYVHIWVTGEKRENLTVEDFGAAIDGAYLVYRFTVVLTPPADPKVGAVVTSLYDKNTVVDFRFFEDDFLLVEGAMEAGCKFRIARGKGAQSGHPQPVSLTCGT